jgi:WD40 repeat protein
MLAALVLIAHLDRTLPLSHVGRQPAFSPDSKLLAACSADGVVKLMQLPDRKVVKIVRDPGGVTAVDFARDGQSLATASYDGTVKIWRLPDGAPLRTLSGH